MMKKLTITLLLSLSLSSLGACNTVSGVGKDLKKAGEAIENAAERKKGDEKG